MDCWQGRAPVQAQLRTCVGDSGTQVTSGHRTKGEHPGGEHGVPQGVPGPELRTQTGQVRKERIPQAPEQRGPKLEVETPGGQTLGHGVGGCSREKWGRGAQCSVVCSEVREFEGRSHVPRAPGICWRPAGKVIPAAVHRGALPAGLGVLSILPPHAPPAPAPCCTLCVAQAGVRDPGPGQTVPPPLPLGALQGAKGASDRFSKARGQGLFPVSLPPGGLSSSPSR